MILTRAWPALLVVVVGLAAIAAPLTLSEAHDQDRFHVPVIRQFAAEMPAPNLASYNAAMTPLYHLVMAIAVRAGLSSVDSLAVLTLLLSAIGVCGIQWFFTRFTSEGRAAVAAACIGLSPYYLGAAVFVATDNPPFVLTAVALGAVMGATPARGWLAPLAVTAAILTRQIYIWLVPFIVAASALKSSGGSSRARAVLAAMAWMAIPAAMLAALLWVWGGPLPRGFSAYRHPPSLLPIAAILATLGIWAVPIVPALWKDCDRRRAAILFAAVAAAASLLLVLAPITDAHGSPWGGGMRTLGKYAGTIAGTSIIYWAGMWIGSLTLALLVARTHASHERLLLIAAAFWMAAQCLNASMSERYYHPFILLVLFAFAARLRGRGAAIGTALLAASILLATFVRFAVHGAGLLRL